MNPKYLKNRVMVVDDEEFCLSAVKAMLALCGLDVNRMVDFCING